MGESSLSNQDKNFIIDEEQESKMRGKFITFEGIEGCGKSTQAKLLSKYLKNKNKKVLLTREPGGPSISEKIRNILLDNENSEMVGRTEVLLYSASRSQHTAEWIIPSLERGLHVICDRYYDSTRAYQGAARKIDRKIIDIITTFASFEQKPDITFLIDLPVKIGLSRIKKNTADRLERESTKFHQKVRDAFLEIAYQEKQRFCIIDGAQSKEKIHDDILENLFKRIEI